MLFLLKIIRTFLFQFTNLTKTKENEIYIEKQNNNHIDEQKYKKRKYVEMSISLIVKFNLTISYSCFSTFRNPTCSVLFRQLNIDVFSMLNKQI